MESWEELIDKSNEPARLEGKSVILEEIQPKFFPYIVEWRNNPELNKFVNQPFKLTSELEQKWFEEIYLKDETQGLWVMLDKKTQTPFGTTGFTDLDRKNRVAIGGRLMLGDEKFAHHPAFFESFFVGSDHIYEMIDTQYVHIVKNNRKALRINKIMGYVPNTGKIQYPHELFRNGMEQREFYRTKEMYIKIRKKLWEDMNGSLFG